MSQISRSLKVLARDLDVPIIALSQLSRAVEQRHDKRPILSDLRESGSIEQDADIVMFIYRDEYYNGEESDQQGLAEVIVAKHRNGPTDTVKLSFLKRYAKFSTSRPRSSRKKGCEAPVPHPAPRFRGGPVAEPCAADLQTGQPRFFLDGGKEVVQTRVFTSVIARWWRGWPRPRRTRTPTRSCSAPRSSPGCGPSRGRRARTLPPRASRGRGRVRHAHPLGVLGRRQAFAGDDAETAVVPEEARAVLSLGRALGALRADRGPAG